MNSALMPSVWRFVILVALQLLLLLQISQSAGTYFNILIYPLFIFFLPLRMPTPYAILLGFACGMAVDFGYSSPGVHASAAAFSAFARSFLFGFFEPKGGFSGKENVFAPAYFGWAIFLQVLAAFLMLHLFWYFSVAEFTYVYFTTILLKTLAAWVLTMIFAVFYTLLFNPKR